MTLLDFWKPFLIFEVKTIIIYICAEFHCNTFINSEDMVGGGGDPPNLYM